MAKQETIDSDIPDYFVTKMKEALSAHRHSPDEMTMPTCINLCWQLACEEIDIFERGKLPGKKAG